MSPSTSEPASSASSDADGILSLHVLPPAFGLPTPDPDCLTAILYLSHALPAGRWVVVSDGWRDFEAGQELPVLRHGTEAYHGLDAILAYLRTTFDGVWNLDLPLEPVQRADCLAFTAHLATYMAPLVTLIHHTLPRWTAWPSHPSLATALTFPRSWTLPGLYAARIKARRPPPAGVTVADLAEGPCAEEPDASPAAAKEEQERALAGPMLARPAVLGPGAGGLARAAARRARAQAALREALDRARGPFTKLLGSGDDGAGSSERQKSVQDGAQARFVLGSKGPTSLDCALAAHLALLLAEMPEHLVRDALGAEACARWESYVRGVVGERLKSPPWRAPPARSTWEEGWGATRAVWASAAAGAGFGAV